MLSQTSFVVKKGSNTRSRCSGAIPRPVSRTSMARPVLVAASGDGQVPALGHRLEGVGHQVHDHLLHLLLVGHEARQAGRELLGHLHSADRPLFRISARRFSRLVLRSNLSALPLLACEKHSRPWMISRQRAASVSTWLT